MSKKSLTRKVGYDGKSVEPSSTLESDVKHTSDDVIIYLFDKYYFEILEKSVSVPSMLHDVIASLYADRFNDSTMSTSSLSTLDQQRYDYVIVGGGPSAMGLLYGMLQSDQQFSVCLIEAGPDKAPSSSNHARHWFWDSHLRDKKACLKSVPQRGLNNRVLDIPVGSGLGGGSNINACFYVKPDFRNDFRSWPGEWSDGLKIEKSCDIIECEMRRNGGVKDYHFCDKFHKLTSNNSLPSDDIETIQTVDGERSIKFYSSFQLTTTGQGIRVNYFESLVYPYRCDKRLRIIANTRVRRILWSEENKKAIGVECSLENNTSDTFIYCTKEVILCAGAIYSPVLLMKSGIGDKTKLSQLQFIHKSQKIHHLPAVGRNLQDHFLIARAFLTFPQWGCKRSIMGCQGWYSTCTDLPDNFPAVGKEGKGVDFPKNASIQVSLFDGCTTNELLPSLSFTCIRRKYSSVLPTFLFGVTHAVSYYLLYLFVWFTPLRWVAQYMTAISCVCILNPSSKGSINLNNDGEVIIDPAYITHEMDIIKLQHGWEIGERLSQYHFAKVIELLPGRLMKLFSLGSTVSNDCCQHDEKYPNFIPFARNFVCPYYHWIGSCSMGCSTSKEKDFVVDESFQVTGIRGLRVCDASVLPSLVAGPTALTCASIGHACSDIILSSSQSSNVS